MTSIIIRLDESVLTEDILVSCDEWKYLNKKTKEKIIKYLKEESKWN